MNKLRASWRTKTLGECGQWLSGGTPDTSKAEYWGGDIPWISASSLHDFHISGSDRRITKLGAQKGTKLVPENTVIFVVRGMSLKTEFRVGITRRQVAFGQDCKAIIPAPDVDPLFLANALRARAKEILGLVDEAGHGTGRLQTEPLTKLEIDLPSLLEQRAIAGVLGTLDDKIELNRRMNETLEQMARALFKSWFVDFDPVRAKAEGRQPAGLDAETAALFPDSFVDTPLGDVPAGWTAGRISEILELQQNTLDPSVFPTEVFEHYSIPAYDNGQMPKPDLGIDIKSNKHVVTPDCVLLSKLNPDIPRVWLPAPIEGKHSICSTEFLVAIPRIGWRREFIYALLSSSAFLDVFATLVTGTSGSHQRVKPDYLLGMSIVMPPVAVAAQYADMVLPIYAQQAHNRTEALCLTALRDTLLPKLLSGEVRVKDAEALVGRAT